MKKVEIILILGLIAVIILPGCKKSAELDIEYIPEFSGTPETFVSFTTVSFKTSFGNLNPAYAEFYGFEWGKKSDASYSKVLAGKISGNTFSAQVPVKLSEGVEYMVRAWIKTKSKKFYSLPTYFYGSVALKPEILSINRSYAIWGDTITMMMKNLTQEIELSDINVKIGNIEARCVSASPEKVSVIMPFSDIRGSFEISMSIAQQTAISYVKIENAIPIITSVDKNQALYEDLITLSGSFKSEYAGRILPAYKSSTWESGTFDIISYTDDKLVIKIPASAACLQQMDIYLKFIGAGLQEVPVLINTKHSITRKGNWAKLGDAPIFNELVGAAVNGEAYVLEKIAFYYANSPFYKYNPKTDQWTALQSYPSPSYTDQCLVVCNGDIYAGFLRNGEQTTNFYKYSVQNNKWTPCANFPSTAYFTPYTAVCMQGKIYVFTQGTGTRWCYDPALNTWTETACNTPDMKHPAKMFEINGEYYFFRSESDNSYYKYNPGTNVFSVEVINGLGSTSNYFLLGSKLYGLSGCTVYQIDILNKTLIPTLSFSNYLYPYFMFNQNPMFFTHNNTAYFLSATQTLISFSPDR